MGLRERALRVHPTGHRAGDPTDDDHVTAEYHDVTAEYPAAADDHHFPAATYDDVDVDYDDDGAHGRIHFVDHVDHVDLVDHLDHVVHGADGSVHVDDDHLREPLAHETAAIFSRSGDDPAVKRHVPRG
jgi:hypothetical protein